MGKTKNKKLHYLVQKENEVSKLFKEQKYIEVLKTVKNMQKTIDLGFLDYSYFNNKVSCLIYAALSYAELGFYKQAYKVFIDISKRFAYLKFSKITLKGMTRYPDNKSQADMAKELLVMLEEQINIFYCTNHSRFLSNFAYICYKLGNYRDAIVYYKKALCRKNKDIQLNLGIAQAQYYFYRKKFKYDFLNNLFCNKLPKEIENQYKKTIEMLFKMETNFDTLLALGKMYYFRGKYSRALIFVQKAIEIAKDQPNARVHAYDWLSRIAFKTKHHEVAAEYYNQIIKEIIECSDYTQDAIHPKPNLYKMLEYLTENKEKIRKHDVHYINKSIWGGIIAAIILESFEIYSNGTHSAFLLLTMVVIVLLVSVFYINVYK